MREELQNILENDEICYRESEEDADNEYKRNLGKLKREKTQKIF